MDEFWRLVLLSLSMFIGCYLAGSIPLILSLSEGVLRKVTTFGAGLLIGTALIVIIPEGMESLFGEVLNRGHHHNHVEPRIIDIQDPILSHQLQPPEKNLNQAMKYDLQSQDHQIPKEDIPQGQAAPVLDMPVQRKLQNYEDVGVELDRPNGNNGEETLNRASSSLPDGNYTTDQLQFLMGLSLVIGFIFMLLIDQCGGGHSHTHSTDAEGGAGRQRRKNMTATIGLVVHAAADGLALGAAAGLSKADVELIIFFAIMLHKAPAAFGFTSFLIHEGYDKATAKKHLLIFSLAAPVSAFVSYFGLVKVMYTVQLPITGIAMLFSAGTFLYVSTVHVLNEITQTAPHMTSDPTGSSSVNSKLSKVELFLVVSGALLPLVFNAVHSHSH